MTTRTRLTYEMRGQGRAAVPEIAAIAAEYLGWDDARREAEIAAYIARCEAEDVASQLTDEEEAALARSRADEVTELITK